MLRRFSRKIQQSSLIIRAKKGQHFTRTKSKKKLREDAIRRSHIREKNEYLRKIGKLEDREERGRGRMRK
jgi:hypothetical protein